MHSKRDLRVSERPAHGGAELGLWSRRAQDIHARHSGVPLAPSTRAPPCPPPGNQNERVTDLGHLGEEADGHGQGEAEGGKAHEALDGKKHPRSGAQESRPARQTDVTVRERTPTGTPFSAPLASQQPSLERRPSNLAPRGLRWSNVGGHLQK